MVIEESIQVLINKNVMEETMLWSDSINNGGEFSCSHHNLHFKAHKGTNTQRVFSQILTKLSSNHLQSHSCSQTDTPSIDSHFEVITATTPSILHHPMQTSLSTEQSWV